MNDKMRKVLIVFLVLLAAGCGLYLFWYYYEAGKNRDSDEHAKEQAYEKKTDPEKSENGESENPIDFVGLQSVNPDVYAWIRIEDTNIDYPIVQSREDNTYYLDHTWEKESAPSGAIFTQTYNHRDFQDYNTVVYGHRMSDASPTMFYSLHQYLDADYMEQHSRITVYTENHILTYRVFAAVVYDDRLIPMYYNFSMDEQRQKFLDSIYASTDLRNQYAEDVQVDANDRILTLSTCLEGEATHRLLVEAVLIDEK